jgi:hypothetical protein
VLGKNIDIIEKAAEAAGSLITEENKAKYTEVWIFQLLYEVYNILWPVCALIKVFNVTY